MIISSRIQEIEQEIANLLSSIENVEEKIKEEKLAHVLRQNNQLSAVSKKVNNSYIAQVFSVPANYNIKPNFDAIDITKTLKKIFTT